MVCLLLCVGGVPAQTKPPSPVATDEESLRKAQLKPEAGELLAFFRKRTLPDAERPTLQKLIRSLGSESFAERDRAANALAERGPAAAELLRAAANDKDLEVARRADRCLQRIADDDVPSAVPPAAVRVLAHLAPAGAVETMLAFAPFADNDSVADEVRALLTKLAVKDGKPDPLLVAALTDASPVRRAAAGEALARAGPAEQRPAVRKLLEDADPTVRFRVAQALAHAKDAGAVPVLIATIPDLPLPLVWQAEDFLLHLAEGHTPPSTPVGNDAMTRQKCRDAWLAWWKAEGPKVNLARLEDRPKMLGRTLLVLLDQGRVMEVGADKQMLWRLDGLSFPLDVQLLGDDRLLAAEYYGNKVTERNLKGDVLWSVPVTGPLVAQRLANGNTFVATDSELLEFDPKEREVLKIEMPGDAKRVMKAMKLPNGEIACLTADARVVRLDAKGKELAGFNVNLGTRLFGGRIQMLPSGRVLVPHNAEDKVIEYDGQGKAVWEVAVEKPVMALRLPNGNTLVTSMTPAVGAVEFDRAGNEVWAYRTSTRVTRAIRR